MAHFLRSEHGVGADNIAHQGAALYDEYVLLRTFVAETVLPRELRER